MHSIAGRHALAPLRVIDPAIPGLKVASQFGAEELLAELVSRLGAGSGWCAEVRARGTVVPPMVTPLLAAGYDSLVVEDWQDHDTLDEVLAHGGAPADLDLLVLDVDHTDADRWATLTRFRPRIVAVGFDPTQPPHLRGDRPGHVLAAVETGRALGYQLVETTPITAVFVRDDQVDRLGPEAVGAAPREDFHSLELTPYAAGGRG